MLKKLRKVNDALLVVRRVENWEETIGFLRSPSPKIGQLRVVFRGSLGELTVTDRETAWGLVTLTDLSSRLGYACTRDDAEAIMSLYKTVRAKLRTRFSSEEIMMGMAGADFTPKEVALYVFARRFRPKTVVETGVAQGVSSTALLRALAMNGEGSLVSVDLPNHNATGLRYPEGGFDPSFVPEDLMTGWLVPDELRSRWELRLGRSDRVLPTLSGGIDMFYHDSEHSYRNMSFEYEWAYAHLRVPGILFSDDINWNPAYGDFVRRHKEVREVYRSSTYGVLSNMQKV